MADINRPPQMPRMGTNLVQGIYNTVRDICAYLPTLRVVGDNKTTSVSRRAYGQVVTARPTVQAAPAAPPVIEEYPQFAFSITEDELGKKWFNISRGWALFNGQPIKVEEYSYKMEDFFTTNASSTRWRYQICLKLFYNGNQLQVMGYETSHGNSSGSPVDYMGRNTYGNLYYPVRRMGRSR